MQQREIDTPRTDHCADNAVALLASPPVENGEQTGLDVGIAEAAQRCGLSAHTLRYYERIGLIHPVGRGPDGHRRYTEHDLEWLILLTRLRCTGMSISDMCRYAELVRRGPETAGQRRELLVEHRTGVAARIAELQRDLEVIDYKIDMYSEMERSQ